MRTDYKNEKVDYLCLSMAENVYCSRRSTVVRKVILSILTLISYLLFATVILLPLSILCGSINVINKHIVLYGLSIVQILFMYFITKLIWRGRL